MAYNPNQPVQLQIEVYVPPLGWVDITARGRKASCRITQGRTPGAIQAESSRLNLVIGNPDGWVSEDNPGSPWYPYIGRGCPIRVSRLGLTVSPAQRFYGQIDTMVGSYPGGNVDATTAITAIGTLGILVNADDSLRSALYRAMIGISEGDFRPIAHWSMEEGSDSSSFASSFPSQAPAEITGSVSPGSYSGFAGSQPLPILNQGTISAAFPSYVDTGIWQSQFSLMIPSSGFSNDADMLIVPMVPGKPTATIYLTFIQSSGELRLSALNAAGTSLASADSVGNTWQRDTPYLCAITDTVIAGTHTVFFSIYTTGGSLLLQLSITPDGIGAGTAGMPARGSAVATAVSSGWSFGQLALYTDPAVITTPSIGPNAQASGGYVGELAGERMVRLAREEGVAFELTGSAADTPPMGPQLTDTLPANLRDCEQTDQGLMHDNGTAGAIVYATRTSLYNKTASLAVVRGTVEPGLSPTWDNRYVANDVTSRRSNGGWARVTDDAHIAKVGARRKGDRRPNVEDDDQLPFDAGWAVHVGTAPGARYDSVGINLRNPDGALLADQVAAHAIGDRLTVAKAALPPQHSPDGIDGLTVGWTELLDADTWRFQPNAVPYWPYQVVELDSAVYGRLEGDHALASPVTATATSWSVKTNSGPVLTAVDAEDGMQWMCEGELVTVTDIAGTSSPQTATVVRNLTGLAGGKAHGTDAAVTLFPAPYLGL